MELNTSRPSSRFALVLTLAEAGCVPPCDAIPTVTGGSESFREEVVSEIARFQTATDGGVCLSGVELIPTSSFEETAGFEGLAAYDRVARTVYISESAEGSPTFPVGRLVWHELCHAWAAQRRWTKRNPIWDVYDVFDELYRPDEFDEEGFARVCEKGPDGLSLLRACGDERLMRRVDDVLSNVYDTRSPHETTALVGASGIWSAPDDVIAGPSFSYATPTTLEVPVRDSRTGEQSVAEVQLQSTQSPLQRGAITDDLAQPQGWAEIRRTGTSVDHDIVVVETSVPDVGALRAIAIASESGWAPIEGLCGHAGLQLHVPLDIWAVDLEPHQLRWWALKAPE